MLCLSGILGCGGAAPGSAPKPAPTVAAGTGDALPPMEAEQAPLEANAFIDKDAECNAMIDVINKTIHDSTAASQTPANSQYGADGYEAMVQAMDKARMRLAKLHLRDARLRGFAQEYQDMAVQVVKAGRALILAAKENDSMGAKKASGEVTTAVQKEDLLVDAINAYCHAP